MDLQVFPGQSKNTRRFYDEFKLMIWRVWRNRISTSYNLSKLGVEFASIMCPLCVLEVEQLYYIFLKCEIAAKTWNAMFKWLDISPFLVVTIIDFLKDIDQLPISTKKKSVVDAVFFTEITYIRRFKNDKVFSGGTLKQRDIVDSIRQFSLIL